MSLFSAGYKLKTDKSDTLPAWTEQRSVIWGARALLAFFFIFVVRYCVPLGGRMTMYATIFGVISISVIAWLEIRRIKSKANTTTGCDTQPAPPEGRGAAPRP